MRPVGAFLAAAILLLAPPALAASDLTAPLDAAVAAHFPSSQPGAVVLVKKDDQILLRKAYGLADMELAVPMRPELVFRLGSVTKQFTAAAIMLLVDQGKISLQDDLRKYVPSYPKHDQTITIENLLTHTSGVPSYTSQSAYIAKARQDMTHEQLLATFKDLPLDFPPGQKWSYSNSGYYLLGMVIEKVSGESYAQFIDKHIFKPLGMSHSGYGDAERIVPGRVAGYDRQDDTTLNAEPISMKPPFSAGALISNVDDMALWDRAISDGKLLKKQSWARVFTRAKLKDGKPTDYGFGWVITEWQGHRIVAHEGGIPGFNSEILRMPDDHVLVVILCNSSPAPTDIDALALKLAAQAIGKPLVDPKAVAVAKTVLDRYAGVYKVDEQHRAIVRRDGDHLTLQPAGGPLLDLTAESDTKFFVRDTPLRLSFTLEGAGNVTSLDVLQPDGSFAHRARTNEPLPAERATVKVDAKILESYVGDYELAPDFVIGISREETRLFGQATGQPRFEMFPSSPTEFFLKVVEAQVSFHKDAKGQVDSLVLHQNGRDMPGKRKR
jgi:D-alanyl-D-alanine carboxypeptidase